MIDREELFEDAFEEPPYGNALFEFAYTVFSRIGINIKEEICCLKYWDLDRLFIDVDEKSYIIRTWDIAYDGIRFTLFEDLGNSGEDIYSGYYLFNNDRI